MCLTEEQEKQFNAIEDIIKKMSFGETKQIKTDHAAYNNFMKICHFIRHHNFDLKENYYLIISPEEIKKETTIAHTYIQKLEASLNAKTF